jgi:hypothetical protein
MLVIKPYGRTLTEDTLGERKRQIVLTVNRPHRTEIADFAQATPDLHLAQWVSILDKIGRKPSGTKPATPEQKALRQILADAAWALIIDKSILTDADKPVWDWKVHPYAVKEPHPKAQPVNPKGRWYQNFVGTTEPEDLTAEEAKQVAEKIHAHLYTAEMRMGEGTKPKRAGRITLQVNSIAKSVHAEPASKVLDKANDWSDAESATYFATHDVAKLIRAKADEQVEKRKSFGRNIAGPILYEHYARLFTKDGAVLSIEDARNAHPGLFALHMAVKDCYNALLNREKRTRPHVLPPDSKALLTIIGCREQNASLAHLVRLGKVIHYEATSSGALDTPKDVTTHWPTKITNSRYWTSDGQTEIKRNEALVRVWKSGISLAARTLTSWCGSQGDGDVLMAIGTRFEAGQPFDASAFDQKCGLLFGNAAGEFTALAEEDKKQVLRFGLKGWSELRNNSFHFNGRKGYFKALKKVANLAQPDGATAAALIAKLWNDDQAGRITRIKAIMVATHLDDFLDQARLQSVFAAVEVAKPRPFPMPRLRRVLHRVETSWRKKGFALTLPAPCNREELKAEALMCQFNALKLLYERAFPTWDKLEDTATLNGWIKRASERATSVAKALNNNELAESRMSHFGLLLEKEDYGDLADRLAAETATHFRVQNHYASNADGAREQADHLNNLKCDVTALAFEQWLRSHGFGWLLDWDANAQTPLATISDTAKLIESAPVVAGEDWQKRLYFLIHMVPVDDVSRLLHQLRKWVVLEKKDHIVSATAFAEIEQVEAVFALYLDMHDAKFEGGSALQVDDAFKAVFESKDDFDALFRQPGDPVDDRYIPVRGLREILRFGDFKPLEKIFVKHKVERIHVVNLEVQELERDGLISIIAYAQAFREKLHAEWLNARNKRDILPKIQTDYCKALAQVVSHRHRANHVRLNNHVRLHRLLMAVLARLVDYAGLWERDLYFVSMALVHLKGETISNCFSNVSALADGQIIMAVTNSTLTTDLALWFGADFLGASKKTRNDLSHFNMLQVDKTTKLLNPLNLTALVNETRQMMAYDRKLKNAVSVSVIELLEREGLYLTWDSASHRLDKAKIIIKQATHLGTKTIVENLHSDIYGQMAAALFAGTFKGVPDVRTVMPEVRVAANRCVKGGGARKKWPK